MSSTRKLNCLIIGANGYIGFAVAKAFVRAGYSTYGLVRSQKSKLMLQENGIVPNIESVSHAKSVISALEPHAQELNIIVSTTEQLPDYLPHFKEIVKLLRVLSTISLRHGTKPLVLFTSGCKDYGQGPTHGSADLSPHVETTPLNPPAFLEARAHNAIMVLDRHYLFDAAVLRPTNVHGGGSSYYGYWFEIAATAKRNGEGLVFEADPDTILHSMNVEDCAEAYVALASHAGRRQIQGQCFNISARKYETLREVAAALSRVYDIEIDTKYTSIREQTFASALVGWSQWVGSDKIRKLTGWSDTQPMFAEGVERYKAEYEAAVAGKDEGVLRIKERYEGALGQTKA